MYECFVFDEYEAVSDSVYEELLMLMPEGRKKKARTYRRRRDRISCVMAFCLLEYALVSESPRLLGRHMSLGEWLSDNRLSLAHNSFGKPYLKEYPQIHFNLSHCDRGCACVLADSEAGVDIQDGRSITRAMMCRVCHPDELAYLAAADNPTKEFIRLWAMKEAWVKMEGTGISVPLNQVDTMTLGDRIRVLECDKYILTTVKRSETNEDVNIQHIRKEQAISFIRTASDH